MQRQLCGALTTLTRCVLQAFAEVIGADGKTALAELVGSISDPLWVDERGHPCSIFSSLSVASALPGVYRFRISVYGPPGGRPTAFLTEYSFEVRDEVFVTFSGQPRAILEAGSGADGAQIEVCRRALYMCMRNIRTCHAMYTCECKTCQIQRTIIFACSAQRSVLLLLALLTLEKMLAMKCSTPVPFTKPHSGATTQIHILALFFVHDGWVYALIRQRFSHSGTLFSTR